MSTVNVTLKAPSTMFPNFPNACEEIKRMAEEMGLQRNIQIVENTSEAASVQHISKPSDVATLILHHNFPENCFNGTSVAKEFTLRREIAHMKFEDDSADQSSKCLRLFAGVVGFGAGCAAWYALSTWTRLEHAQNYIATLVFLGVSNFVCVSARGGRSAYQFREKRADIEACKYLSIEEKIKEMAWLKKNPKATDGSFYFSNDPDPHPDSRERIQTIWESFTQEQKAQHEELKQEYLLS